MTALAAAVPITSPAIPSGLYSARLTITSTTMFRPASPVGIHGRRRAKNVRVSSRLMPPNGRLTANQNSAVATRLVECGGELAALVDEPRDRRRQHHQHAPPPGSAAG